MAKDPLSHKQNSNEYLERMRRCSSKRSMLKQHKGSTEYFIKLTEAKGRHLGSIRPVVHWPRDGYAMKLFGVVADKRNLYRAMQSLKGMAPGIDGVHLADTRRYTTYRQWLEACGLHGRRAPIYTDTVFPKTNDLGLYIIYCMCDPDHRYQVEHIEFDAKRKNDDDGNHDFDYRKFRNTLDELKRMKPGFFVVMPEHERNRKIREIEKSFPGKTRRAKVPLQLTFSDTFDSDPEDRMRYFDMLRRAGIGEVSLDELAKEFFAGIERLLELQHSGRAKSFIISITPLTRILDYLGDDTTGIREALDWSAMRWTGRLLNKIPENGKGYRPQPLRVVEVSKPDGGVRRLSLPTAVDRIVAKSALMALEPVMEEVFLPSSVGCRVDRDRFDALATLADRYPTSKGKVIVVADIQKAFDNVPHDTLMEVIDVYVPNATLRTLLERIIRRPGFEAGKGLAQGCPLSPSFLNMLLHVHLDEPIAPFMKDNGLTYYRYVDDLCVFGLESFKQGQAVIARIDEFLRPVGLELHTKAPKTQIVDLSGMSTEYYVEPEAYGITEIDRYLGLGLRGGNNGRLEFFLPSSWETRIREMYVNAERAIRAGGYAGDDGAHMHILHATQSWIRAFAPALQHEDEDGTVARIIEICRSVSCHTSAMDPAELARTWSKTQDWWTRKCSEV